MRAHVLIVERDVMTRETIIDLLKVLGHLGFGAESPAVGLKMLELVVFDAMMISPDATLVGKTSYALEAKQTQPQLKVIMAAAVELPEFLQPPIDAFVQKPFSLLSLMKTLGKIPIQSAYPDD
jgi:CheY-like chemotaxis protein